VPSSDPIQRFEDILFNVGRIYQFTSGMDAASFATSEQVVYAVKYALLTISEAAAKLGAAASELCPEIPWRSMRGLGNRLRHDYDSINVTQIWFLIERDLPALKAACERALRTLAASEQSPPEQRSAHSGQARNLD